MPLPDPPTEKAERLKQERETWAEAMRRREAKRKAQIDKVLDYARKNEAPHG